VYRPTEFAVGDSLDESEQICRQRSRVASCRRCERTRRQSWPSLQFPACAVELLRLVTRDDIMTSLLTKLSISIKIHVVKPPRSLFGQFPNCRPNPSAVVVSYSCEFCTHMRRRRDSTRQLSRVCVGGVYWALDTSRRSRSHRPKWKWLIWTTPIWLTADLKMTLIVVAKWLTATYVEYDWRRRIRKSDKMCILDTFCPFYRAMHFSAFARSWDRMSSVCPSVRLSVCL